MKETIICKLCLEPIFNYICANCLESSIEKWLGGINQELLVEFRNFSKNLKVHFESYFQMENCIKCRENMEVTICPYCYSKEVFDFLSSRELKISESFIKFFNFDFLKVGYSSENIIVRNSSPIITAEKEESSDMNICENCGNPSDDLREVNGSYICEACRDES